MLGLYKSNVHNLVSTLETMGYLEKNLNSGKYFLSMKFLKFSHSALNHFSFRRLCLPYLTSLCNELNEHIALSVPVDLEILYLDSLYPVSRPEQTLKLGSTLPLHCTSEGKVMMAFAPGDLYNQLLSKKKLIAYTSNTITDPVELKKKVEETKQLGYNIARMEYTFTNVSIAIPLNNSKGEFMAVLTCAGPAQHFTDDRCQFFLERMRHVAADISEVDRLTSGVHYDYSE